VTISERIDKLNWPEIERALGEYGYALTGPLLEPEECKALADLYRDETLFRSRIEMARYRFGQGDYQYFANPLPKLVQDLRDSAYPYLARMANSWNEVLGASERFPHSLDMFLEQCHALGQTKPTPLLLHYEAGGYNCLHQDLYGELAFPLQLVCCLSQPGRDFSGGEFLVLEQRPRAQSAGEAVLPALGEAVIFTTRYRPVKGARGYYRANMKHGVSRIRSGSRYTLGVIFHDAK
jgi:hypothetical protein